MSLTKYHIEEILQAFTESLDEWAETLHKDKNLYYETFHSLLLKIHENINTIADASDVFLEVILFCKANEQLKHHVSDIQSWLLEAQEWAKQKDIDQAQTMICLLSSVDENFKELRKEKTVQRAIQPITLDIEHLSDIALERDILYVRIQYHALHHSAKRSILCPVCTLEMMKEEKKYE